MTPRKPQAPPSPAVAPVQTDPSFRTWSLAIFAVALAIRLLHTWLLSRSPFFDALLGDAKGYDDWAQRLAAGDWIGTDVFYQAPLYPYFLGVVYKVSGHSLWAVRICQSLVGAGSCALLGLAARRFFGHRAGLIAGFGLAVYAPAVFFDALVQKSVLDLFFITLALWLVSRLVDAPGDAWSWVGLGLAMGGMSLTRENALVFVGLIVVWIIAMPLLGRLKPAPTVGGRDALVGAGFSQPNTAGADVLTVVGSGFSRTRSALLFLAGLGIVLMPVAVRNYAVGGGFYLTTSQFGPNFYIGNNPQADGTYASLRFGRGAPEYERTDATELAEHALGRTLSPAEVSGYWTGKALEFIANQPAAWLRLEARKVALLFNATEMLDTEAQESHAEWSWPLRAGGWFGHFGLLVPLAFVGLVVAWPDRRRLALLYAMLPVYAASVVLFYVFARYRLPLVPMLLLFAAAGLAELPQWLQRADTRARTLVGAGVVVLAVALQQTGKVAEAAGHYSRAIELQPDYAPAYNNLGVMQRAMGQVDQAIATYERALALKGTYPDAHYNLANALLEKGRAQEAAEHFRIALQSIPDSAGAANNLGVALANQNRPTDAVAAFRAAVAAEPNSAVAHRNLADALATAGNIAESVAEFTRAAELDPADPATPYNLGIVLIEAQRIPEAIAALRRAVALAPNSVDARNNLGIALGSSGDLDGAIAEFRRALALDASSAEARRNLEVADAARAQAQGSRR